MDHVLIIEDDSDFATSLELILGLHELQAVHVASGEDALALLERRQGNIRLAFMDIKLPGMDGLSCLQEIHSRWPEIICIVMTGFRDKERLDRAHAVGAADILLKPFRMEKFVDLVKRYL
ncbi:MAG: hypothetical protein C0619_01310 [Desulfuromonas sp.]|nr:MAG: hypothetical protein C0619_01310 [Desulfuromonas sp.]